MQQHSKFVCVSPARAGLFVFALSTAAAATAAREGRSAGIETQMAEVVLPVEVRERTGSGGARETRRAGRVPGVLYGGTLEPVAVSTPLNEVVKGLNRGGLLSQVIEIDHKGEKQAVIVRDIQFDPVSDTPIHMDFYRVEADQEIAMEVTVRFTNEDASPGLKRGGVLNVVRHQVELFCPANAIPDELVVDLTGREIGDTIHISAVTLPQGVRPTIADRDFTIATIQGSRAATEAAKDDGDGEGES